MSVYYPAGDAARYDERQIRRTPGGAIDYDFYVRIAHRERAKALASITAELTRAFRKIV